LVHWLNELIELVFAEHFLPIKFRVDIDADDDDKSLIAHITGCYFDPDSGEIEAEIKAATYHNVKIEHLAKGYTVEVIIDV
jgi:SHS2 domain-containing protein